MQTRHDLEFMADMLGTVEQRTVGGFPDMRPPARYGFMSTDQLASAVAAGAKNFVANTWAQVCLLDLLLTLPIDGRRPGPMPAFRGFVTV